MTLEKRTDAAGNFSAAGYRWLSVLIRRLISLVHEWHRCRKTLAVLESLDKRALSDIGLSRDDLISIRSGVFFRDRRD